MRVLITLLGVAALAVGCARDKTVPPPPQGSIIDVTQPAELGRPRQLLEQITAGAGVVRKLDAYKTPVDCVAVADFYNQAMRAEHWKQLAAASHSPNEFASRWRYMSRTAYVVGAPSDGPIHEGCVVMAGVFSYVRSHVPHGGK